MPESAKKSLVIFTYTVLILSILLVYWHVRNFDFVSYDDDYYVYENQHVLNGLTYDGIVWAFTTGYANFWHPVTWLSLMLNTSLFGPDPGWFHLVNIFGHIANTLLLFAVLKKMTGSLWPSAFVAAAFALHPMHVESVAWITERKDVLSTLFWLLTLAAYVNYVKRPSIFRYLISLAVFVIGLMAKPMLITLPFVLLLLDYWPLDRFAAPRAVKTAAIGDRRRILYRIIVEKIPFIIFSAVFSVIAFLTQQAGDNIVDFKTIPLTDRVANAFLSYTAYMGKMFWPRNLAIFYPFDIRNYTYFEIVLCAALLIIISIFVIRFGRTKKYLPVGWFWFVGTLIPVIGLVQFTGTSYADRFTYIPYIGLFIMIAWGLPELVSKLPQRSLPYRRQHVAAGHGVAKGKIALGVAAAAVLTAMGIVARAQTGYWSNSIALFSHAIEVTQNNYRMYYNLGIAYGKLGQYQDAIEAYQQAIRIKPDSGWAHCNLGVTYGILGRPQDAIEAFKQAIRINPDYARAHYNLGIAYGKLGRYQDAIETYKEAIRINPDYAEAHSNLGNIYVGTGDKGSALEEYKILKKLDVEKANKLLNLIDKQVSPMP
jgi:Flp pilus assembly protein TadD